MYSYNFFIKSNKITEHLTENKQLNGCSKRTNVSAFHLPKICSQFSEEEIEALNNGKEITVTIQTIETLTIKKFK